MAQRTTKQLLLLTKAIANNWQCSFKLVTTEPVVTFQLIPRGPIAVHYLVRRVKQAWDPRQLKATIRIKQGVMRDTKRMEPGETSRDVITFRVLR